MYTEMILTEDSLYIKTEYKSFFKCIKLLNMKQLGQYIQYILLYSVFLLEYL